MPYKCPEARKACQARYRKRNPNKVKEWRKKNPGCREREYQRKLERDPGFLAREYQRKLAKDPQINVKKYRAALLKNPNTRAAYLRQKYDMSEVEWNFMLAGQGFRCGNPACRADEPGGNGYWHTDHIHGTKVVRAILCHGCNTAIGHGKESPAILRGLAEHVEKHQHLCPKYQTSTTPTAETAGALKASPPTEPNAKPRPSLRLVTSSQNFVGQSRKSA